MKQPDVSNQFMTKISASIKSLETQIGQLASLMTTRAQGNLPSTTEVNPKEQCNAISLRSGKELKEPKMVDEKKGKVKEEVTENLEKKHPEISIDYHIKIPYPQRLQKNTLDKQFSKFLDIFWKLHINIQFSEALEQMPSYAKFMKEILSNKNKLKDYEMVALTEECSKALCDLGASVNLMPLSIYQKLKLEEAKSTTMALQMADRSVKHPHGVIEDVLVKVDKFIFPADFIILDMDEDKNIPIILGRLFLATGRALIDVQKRELQLRVQKEEVTFKVFATTEIPTCCRIDAVDIDRSPTSMKNKKLLVCESSCLEADDTNCHMI
ncbi:uncharacterized protein LOC133785138 [Humulus lupulus]|uniref:uncharacterized protein LOC133785138 n=1 Tax=Humulus lupulus TaxID=3486 RepID=UPI002B413783|nr:uncharacterized protein LOC133785138 [Humulus lupulus]